MLEKLLKVNPSDVKPWLVGGKTNFRRSVSIAGYVEDLLIKTFEKLAKKIDKIDKLEKTNYDNAGQIKGLNTVIDKYSERIIKANKTIMDMQAKELELRATISKLRTRSAKEYDSLMVLAMIDQKEKIQAYDHEAI